MVNPNPNPNPYVPSNGQAQYLLRHLFTKQRLPGIKSCQGDATRGSILTHARPLTVKHGLARILSGCLVICLYTRLPSPILYGAWHTKKGGRCGGVCCEMDVQ